VLCQMVRRTERVAVEQEPRVLLASQMVDARKDTERLFVDTAFEAHRAPIVPEVRNESFLARDEGVFLVEGLYLGARVAGGPDEQFIAVVEHLQIERKLPSADEVEIGLVASGAPGVDHGGGEPCAVVHR